MATSEQVNFNAEHPPKDNAIEAFNVVVDTIKEEIIKSRKHWDAHEPKMWSRAHGLTNQQLTDFEISKDLVSVRGGATSYGTIILGKIRIPAVKDSEGAGYIHVRIHDPPNRGTSDVVFHSLWTDEGKHDADGRPTTWRAIQTDSAPLEFFNE